MKKQLSEKQMVNELTGKSSFFKTNAPLPPQTVYQQSEPVPYDRTEVSSVRHALQRPTKRHPFEIYKDQLERLQRLSAQSVLDGNKIGMSEMVREALDNYFQNHP